MNVLFLPQGSITFPSSRYRLYQYLHFLSQYGIKFRVINYGTTKSRLLFAIKLIMYLLWADVVFIQKRRPTKKIMFLIKKLNNNIIFDFDDAIWTINPSMASIYKNHEKTAEQSKNTLINFFGDCKIIIAGCKFLAEFARKYHSNVFLLPTVVNTSSIMKRKKTGARPKIVIGWTGAHNNLYYLKRIEHVFTKLHNKYKDKLVLKVICDRPLDIDSPIEVVNKPWGLHSEINELSECDIGIMPLVDDEWNRGKCAFKMILYMAVGLPVVTSPVGVNKQIIDDGVNGIIAKNDNDWYEKLSALIDNHKLRDAIGNAGRKTIEQEYSLEQHLDKLIAILRLAA